MLFGLEYVQLQAVNRCIELRNNAFLSIIHVAIDKLYIIVLKEFKTL